MKLAFCLFKYYPFGGLERDFLRIAKTCQLRGHEIHVYVMQWQGEIPMGFNIHVIPVRSITNHGRSVKFANLLQTQLKKNNYDVVIGFNRMPGLDIYFAADPCYQVSALRKHGAWYRFMPRYRAYVALEKAVFAPEINTEILLLTPTEQANFIKCYNTQVARFHEIPPGIAPDRKLPADAKQIREQLRKELEIQSDQNLILMVGSDFKRKGVDRALSALASLPASLKNTRLIIIGKGNPKKYLRLAKRLGISEQVQFLGGRHDVLNFLLAADLLLHPAYQETAGMVLLEALAVSLPVLVTDNCGYAVHIERAQAGLLVPSPYKQEALNSKLLQMLTASERIIWRNNALAYLERVNLFGLSEKVADIIELLSHE